MNVKERQKPMVLRTWATITDDQVQETANDELSGPDTSMPEQIPYRTITPGSPGSK